MTRSPGRPGFTLVEALVAMFVFGLLLAVSVALVVALLDLHEADAQALQRTVALTRLADQFRADVAAAADAPARAGAAVAGPDVLLLRRPDGRLVTYRAAAGELRRADPAAAGEERQTYALGGERTSVTFHRAGRLVTLRWHEERGPTPTPARHRLDITAALGGDLP